jgi:AcrR family transcriptional regulator
MRVITPVVQRVRSPLNGTMIGTMQRQKRRSLPSGNNHQARILSAAAEIFLNRGYEETSTAEIARRAKVSKRDLYSNFSDKRDILLAVVTQLQTEIQSQANISWSSDEDLRTVLTRAGTQILTFINSEKFAKGGSPRGGRRFLKSGRQRAAPDSSCPGTETCDSTTAHTREAHGRCVSQLLRR